jgi:beta-N-acetylglucosaminidase
MKFMWNGIKVNGKLYRAFFSLGALLHHPEGTITIYGRDYTSFPAEVRAAFTVENHSDGMTDYFEEDYIRVTPDHPLYAIVKAAHAANEAHYAKRFAKAA